MNSKEMLSDDKYDVRLFSNGEIKTNIPQVIFNIKIIILVCKLYLSAFH